MGAMEEAGETQFTPLPFNLVSPYIEESTSTYTCRRSSLISHNIMHATTEHRLRAILDEYQNSLVIALQGTRRPQTEKKALHCFCRQDFIIYSGGYTQSAGAHSGVILAFNLHHVAREDLKYYHIPSNPLLQVRLVGVRRKT